MPRVEATAWECGKPKGPWVQPAAMPLYNCGQAPGVASILEGMNPRMLETKLLGFLVEANQPGREEKGEEETGA